MSTGKYTSEQIQELVTAWNILISQDQDACVLWCQLLGWHTYNDGAIKVLSASWGDTRELQISFQTDRMSVYGIQWCPDEQTLYEQLRSREKIA